MFAHDGRMKKRRLCVIAGPPLFVISRDTGVAVRRSILFKGEADLHGNLPVSDFLVLDVAAGFYNLDPADVPYRLCRFCDRIVDSLFNAGGRRTDDFDFLIDVCAHSGMCLRVMGKQRVSLIISG